MKLRVRQWRTAIPSLLIWRLGNGSTAAIDVTVAWPHSIAAKTVLFEILRPRCPEGLAGHNVDPALFPPRSGCDHIDLMAAAPGSRALQSERRRCRAVSFGHLAGVGLDLTWC